MLHEQRFFFLASKAIAFALSRVYGRSPFTGYLTNVIDTTALAAGVDAGTTAVPAVCSCAGGIRAVDVDVSAGVEGVDSPAVGAFPVDAGGGDASDKVSGGDSANPVAAISLRACARRNATASGVSRISAEL